MKILDEYAEGNKYHHTHEFECSGKKFSANCHIIGINHELELHEGYDGSLGEYEIDFTPEEKRELADFMLGLWQKFKDSIQ